jgi:hypothetical protein
MRRRDQRTLDGLPLVRGDAFGRCAEGASRMTRFLFLPLPVSKNVWQRMHWAKRNRIKREWHELVWAQVNASPRWPRPAGSVTVDIAVEWDKRGPLPDHHNLEMAFECVADGLVQAGIIADDSGTQFVRGGLTLRRAAGVGRTVACVTQEGKAL